MFKDFQRITDESQIQGKKNDFIAKAGLS